ncbi:MAG: T9SS type A sorting domain-containing protein [Bacteroidota bacterium]
MKKKLTFCALLMLGLLRVSFAQCPAFVHCITAPDTVCANNPNNQELWNESYYWDNVNWLHDLFETQTDLQISAKDHCNFNNLRISYVLLLDLDGDGAQETAIWSDSLPPANAVYFGNAANPGYSGGTLRHFDERAVPANQKYGFALETETQGDTLLTARVRWNTPELPLQNRNPYLPVGTHKIRWFLESGAVRDTCEHIFTVKDCKKPTVNCLNSLSVNIYPNGTIQLYASDFLQNMEDNITPANLLRLGVRKAGSGNGFPYDANGNPLTSIPFMCSELGTQIVELWGIDKAGNAGSCETLVIVQDNNAYCEPEFPHLGVCVATEQAQPIEDASITISGAGNSIPSFTYTGQTNTAGCYNFNYVPLASNSTITSTKDDNPLNGVSTYDLVLISKHILGVESLNSPYKMIAADANKSRSVTTFDIIELRKLILGIYTALPANTSWRFIDKSFVFPSIQNPFQTVFPEDISIQNLNVNSIGPDFVGIKVGDVNGTAIANSVTNSVIDDRNAEHILLPDISATAGQSLDIPITVSDVNAWLGFQFALQYDENQLNIESIEPGDLHDLTAESFAKTGGEIRCSWSDGVAHTLLPGDRLFTLHARALKPLRLRDAVTLTDKRLRAEAYKDDNQAIVPLQLAFGAINATNNQTAVFAPQPNPTNAGAKLPVQLIEDASVRLEIRDVSGKLVYQSEPFLSAGRHLMEIPAEVLPNAGCYFWTIKTGNLIQSGKLIRQ